MAIKDFGKETLSSAGRR